MDRTSYSILNYAKNQYSLYKFNHKILNIIIATILFIVFIIVLIIIGFFDCIMKLINSSKQRPLTEAEISRRYKLKEIFEENATAADGRKSGNKDIIIGK